MTKRTLYVASRFDQFVSGVRTVEIRVGKPKYLNWVGKQVQIYNNDKSHYLTLASVNHYNTLNEYVSNASVFACEKPNTYMITAEQIRNAGGINVLHFTN